MNEFPTGTTGVLVNGKAIPLAEYLASQGEAVKGPTPHTQAKVELTISKSSTSTTAAPAPKKVRAVVNMPVAFATDRAGISHLTDAIIDAGFRTADSVCDASIDDLTTVSGIGKATAVKLKAAAEELLA